MNTFKVLAGFLVILSANSALFGQEQEIEFRDGGYFVKKGDTVSWDAAPRLDVTGSTLVGKDVDCYVNTKEKVVLCFTHGKTWGPETFRNILSVENSLGTALNITPDYIGSLVIEPSRGVPGSGKRLDFYQTQIKPENFVSDIQ